MKTLRLWHTYIACLFAPLTVFFLFTGALQAWNLHKSQKDGSYKAPTWIYKICHVHADQEWPSDNRNERAPRTPFRIVETVLSIGMLFTVSLGLMMAYQLARSSKRISVLLLLGAVIPLGIVLVQVAMRSPGK